MVEGPVAEGPVVEGPVVEGPVVEGPVAEGPVVWLQGCSWMLLKRFDAACNDTNPTPAGPMEPFKHEWMNG